MALRRLLVLSARAGAESDEKGASMLVCFHFNELLKSPVFLAMRFSCHLLFPRSTHP